MKNRRNSMDIIPFIPMILLFLCIPVWSESEGVNLLTNNDFETGNTIGWEQESWNREGTIQVVKDYVFQGVYSLMISSPTIENDIRLVQVIDVEPETYYQLSGWIAAKDIQEKKVGANICLLSGFDYVGNLSGTQDWKRFNLIFKTSKRQQNIKIAARLGMYYNTVTGTAYFDDLKLEKLDYIPESGIILKEPAGSKPEKTNESRVERKRMKKKDPVFDKINLSLIIKLISIGLALVGVNVYITIRREKKNVKNG